MLRGADLNGRGFVGGNNVNCKLLRREEWI